MVEHLVPKQRVYTRGGGIVRIGDTSGGVAARSLRTWWPQYCKIKALN